MLTATEYIILRAIGTAVSRDDDNIPIEVFERLVLKVIDSVPELVRDRDAVPYEVRKVLSRLAERAGTRMLRFDNRALYINRDGREHVKQFIEERIRRLKKRGPTTETLITVIESNLAPLLRDDGWKRVKAGNKVCLVAVPCLYPIPDRVEVIDRERVLDYLKERHKRWIIEFVDEEKRRELLEKAGGAEQCPPNAEVIFAITGDPGCEA